METNTDWDPNVSGIGSPIHYRPEPERQEFDMSEALDWNAKTIAEFRANEGRVGGVFEGAPIALLHHRGRKSGRQYVSPVMYLPHDTEPEIIYVFATRGGAPLNPDWYYNLTAAGDGSVERGTEAYRVTVRELPGPERDRIYAEQARRYTGFAEYERQTAGVRTIPVLELSSCSRTQPGVAHPAAHTPEQPSTAAG
jgi:deazaflavin-dependent oxidoreductase (nitroreductase family)